MNNCENCVHHIDDVCEHCYELNINTCTGFRSVTPQGEWITHITYFECSNCKHCYDYDYAEDIDPVTDLNFNFCPNCGACMQKGCAEND